jgi:hypothetical protein
MNSHNSKAGFAFHKTPARSDMDKRDEKVVSASLNSAELAIADDTDTWTDPYNSTGKHVILKAKLLQSDE